MTSKISQRSIMSISFILLVLASKAQSSDTSSYLNFTSYQTMAVYLDSLGKVEMALGWEESIDNITLDYFGNRIKLRNSKNNKERIFVLGTKGKKYRTSGPLYIVPFFHCTDDKEIRCTIRLMIHNAEELAKKRASYLYIDYRDVTYIYQLFLD